MRASGFIYSHGNITQVISSLFPSAKFISFTYGFLWIHNNMLRVVSDYIYTLTTKVHIKQKTSNCLIFTIIPGIFAKFEE